MTVLPSGQTNKMPSINDLRESSKECDVVTVLVGVPRARCLVCRSRSLITDFAQHVDFVLRLVSVHENTAKRPIQLPLSNATRPD